MRLARWYLGGMSAEPPARSAAGRSWPASASRLVEARSDRSASSVWRRSARLVDRAGAEAEARDVALRRRRRPALPRRPPSDAARPTAPPVVDAPAFERAVARFNASEAGRTAAGSPHPRQPRSRSAPRRLPTRSGSPSPGSSPGTSGGSTSATSCGPVFQLDKGREIDQLDAAARQWNASVGEDGQLACGARPRPTARRGEPVSRS